LLEHPVDRPAHQFAHRAILRQGHRPEPFHDRIGEKNLNLLHGSTL